MIIFLALRGMVKIQCHEAMNVLGLVTVIEKGHGNCCLPSPLLGTLENDPRFTPFQNFLRKVQSWFLRIYFTLYHWYVKNPRLFVYTLISLIYFHTSFLLPPMKGRCSKCLMHVLCLYLFLQNVVYSCVLCMYFEFMAMQLDYMPFLILFLFHSALCFLRCLHVPVYTPSPWLSLLTPWGIPTLYPSTLSVT